MNYDFLTEESVRYLKFIYKKGYKKIPSYNVNQARKIFSDIKEISNQISLPILDKQMEANFFEPKSKNSDTLLVFLHGGGYVFRHLPTNIKLCEKLCNETQSFVLMPHYFLSPEFKFPYAIQQITDLINKLVLRKIKINGDGFKYIYLCGESSGANLAASSAINLEENKKSGIILICPSLDYSNNHATKISYSQGLLLDKEVRDWFSFQYLNSEEEKNNPLVSPLKVEDYNKFSNTLIISAKYDPLYSEACFFYNQTKKYTNSSFFEYPTIHGFMSLGINPYIQDAITDIKKFIVGPKY